MNAGFDDRIVEYETIHKIDAESVAALVKAVSAQSGEIVLDGMDGYGAASGWLLSDAKERGFEIEAYLLDESEVQLGRARGRFPGLPAERIVRADIRETGFPDGKFDAVVIKMGIHEVPKIEQPKIFGEVYRILKPGGRFVTWELALDEETQAPFQDVIRKKDELAGFEAMVRNRYFPRHDELVELFKEAGFQGVEDCHWIDYEPSTLGRKEELVSRERKALADEKGQLSAEDEEGLEKLGLERAIALAEYARGRIAGGLRDRMGFRDLGEDVRFRVRKVIMKGFTKA